MNIKRVKLDIVLNFLSILTLIATILLTILNWDKIPEIIPMHYDFLGNPNRWGNKSELIILIVIMSLMYIIMTVVEKYPKYWNTGVKITEENKDRVYPILLHLLTTTKFIMMCIFTYISVNTIGEVKIHALFVPIFILVLFVNLIYWNLKLLKTK